MMFPNNPFIAAVEFQIIFAVVVGLISFISWITKKLKKNQEEADVGRKRKRQNDDPIRSEIDSFLQDVLGAKPKRNQVEEDDFLEVVEEPQRRRNKRQGKKRKTQLQRKQKPPHQFQQPDIEDRSVGQSGATFGSGLREHVSEHMQLKHFEDDIGNDVDQSVNQHLGSFDSSSANEIQIVSHSKELRQVVLSMMRNPTDVQKAIILNLILTPPVSMRKK